MPRANPDDGLYVCAELFLDHGGQTLSRADLKPFHTENHPLGAELLHKAVCAYIVQEGTQCLCMDGDDNDLRRLQRRCEIIRQMNLWWESQKLIRPCLLQCREMF